MRTDENRKIKKLNYAGRVYDHREIDALKNAADEFWLTSGRYAARFEKEFAEFLGVNHVSLVNSGSSANLLAFMALTQPELGEQRIRRGDEVITTAACFPTTVAPIVQYGAVPVFVDITIPEYNVDCSQLEAALSPKTKAVFLAHTMGNPFDIEKVINFCIRHKLWLIEDNCDALGSLYLYQGEARYTGAFGHIGTSSFYPAHHITMGEGGAVYTDDPRLHRIINSLRDWGKDCICTPGEDNACGRRLEGQHGSLPAGYDHKYVYSHFGYNLKATDMQAAIGCAQMGKLISFVEAREINRRTLRNMLHGTPGLILPEANENSAPSWFAFVLTVKEDAGFTRDELMRHLEERGIQTRMLFAGNILRQPCFGGDIPHRIIGDLRNTDYVMNNSFLVGVYPGLTSRDMEFIGEQILEFVCQPARF